MLSPVYDSVETEMGDKVEFYKVDIDQSMELAERFVVTTVPTVIVFKDGKEMDRLVGFIPKENLKSKIESHI